MDERARRWAGGFRADVHPHRERPLGARADRHQRDATGAPRVRLLRLPGALLRDEVRLAGRAGPRRRGTGPDAGYRARPRAGDTGLDHGAWVPLKAMYPDADIPVLQMSMPDLDPEHLFEVGRRLAPLRDEGTLIVGSGFLTHGLPFIREYFMGKPGAPRLVDRLRPLGGRGARPWRRRHALRRSAKGARHALCASDGRAFAPLFVTLGAVARPDDGPTTAIEGYFYGLSKRSFAAR